MDGSPDGLGAGPDKETNGILGSAGNRGGAGFPTQVGGNLQAPATFSRSTSIEPIVLLP